MKKLVQIISILVLTVQCSLAQATESYIAVERYSKRVLIAANTELVVPLDGFSQLATVKVALDWSKVSGVGLATPVVVPNGVNLANNPLALQPGDKLSLRDLIYSISMANDEVSSMVVADFVGRDLLARRGKTGNSIFTFVKEMNTLAASLKMTKTKFTSPYNSSVVAGSDEGATTVTDLAKLSVGLLSTHGFEFYIKQKSRRLTLARVNGTSQTLTVVNNNKLIGQLGISGMKATGNHSIISANKQAYKEKLPNDQIKVTPVQMLVISLYSPNRDGRVKQLVTTAWQQYEVWRTSGYAISAERKEFLQ